MPRTIQSMKTRPDDEAGAKLSGYGGSMGSQRQEGADAVGSPPTWTLGRTRVDALLGLALSALCAGAYAQTPYPAKPCAGSCRSRPEAVATSSSVRWANGSEKRWDSPSWQRIGRGWRQCGYRRSRQSGPRWLHRTDGERCVVGSGRERQRLPPWHRHSGWRSGDQPVKQTSPIRQGEARPVLLHAAIMPR